MPAWLSDEERGRIRGLREGGLNSSNYKDDQAITRRSQARTSCTTSEPPLARTQAHRVGATRAAAVTGLHASGYT
ncbi:hypothetical protein Pcac1_g22845 [Phytophthora cactorum]|nr:hypothetical protein Pcac1_g22845 [Phytophthora cactorum]